MRRSPIQRGYLMPIVTIGLAACAIAGEVPPELLHVGKRTTVIEAFRPKPECDRHDPSNIIRHEDRYWVFYTCNVDNHRDVTIHAASSADGFIWRDLGLALGCGRRGAWDESGVIAPYVVPYKGRLYLFYTGFHNGDLATRQLGCAAADSPHGPWRRWRGNPVLQQSLDPQAWDSGMLGDSNVLFRAGKWWLYFKSRRRTETARDTHVGVAWAEDITGPYHKHPANPLFAGHAFSAWVQREGVAAICGVISPKIMWSRDGIRFQEAGEMPNTSTGVFCPQNFLDGSNPQGVRWGLERYTEQGRRGLLRFDCTMQAPGS